MDFPIDSEEGQAIIEKARKDLLRLAPLLTSFWGRAGFRDIDAEDLVHDALERSLRRWDEAQDFGVYAKTVLRNCVKDVAKQALRRLMDDMMPQAAVPDSPHESLDRLSQIPDSQPLAFDALMTRETETRQLRALRQAIAALPLKEREAIQLGAAGMSSDEIARTLGSTPSAIRQRLSRAMKKLKGIAIETKSEV